MVSKNEWAQVELGFEIRRMQITICYNQLHSQDEINNALVHEMLHAYDHCRASNMDWTNCDHHACSEVSSTFLLPIFSMTLMHKKVSTIERNMMRYGKRFAALKMLSTHFRSTSCMDLSPEPYFDCFSCVA